MQTNFSFQAVSRAPRGLRAVRPRDAWNNDVILAGSMLPLAGKKNKGLLIVYGDMEMKEINLKDEATTFPSYFCKKGIGTTEKKLCFDFGTLGLKNSSTVKVSLS